MSAFAESLQAPVPPPRERLEGGRVRGILIAAHLAWARDHCSREETIELFEAFGPKRAAIAAVRAKAWYDFALLIEVDRVIIDLFGGGDVRFAEQLGGYAAETIWRPIRDRGDVHGFYRRLPRLRTEIQDFGAVEYVELGVNGGRLLHAADPCFSPVHCITTAGFLRNAAKLHGAVETVVGERTCQCLGDEACAFDVAWH